jgi:hypothetical protein
MYGSPQSIKVNTLVSDDFEARLWLWALVSAIDYPTCQSRSVGLVLQTNETKPTHNRRNGKYHRERRLTVYIYSS